MAYSSQLCETCKNKGNRCYNAPNSTCSAYEPEEKQNKTVGSYLVNLLSSGKFTEAAEFLNSETMNLCRFDHDEYCFNQSCVTCWENFLKATFLE